MNTQQFLAEYFGLKPMGKGSDQISFLSDDNGMVLSLTNDYVLAVGRVRLKGRS